MIITQGLLKPTADGRFKPALLFRVRDEFNHICEFLQSNSVSLTYTNSIDSHVVDKGEGLIFRDVIGNHFIFWIEDAYVE